MLILLTLLFGAYVSELIPTNTSSLKNKNQEMNSPACGTWKKANANAFGLPTEFDEFDQPIKPTADFPFQSEEGFEVLVYTNQLYLGMEADNILGARLWRSRAGVTAPGSQLDWEEVSVNQNGLPFGVIDTAQADHIDSLAEFQNWIYASLANRSGNPKGTLVFKSPNGNPGSWEDALSKVGPGFGKSQNENFKDMQVFDDYLCGGTWNEIDGAEVWCSTDGGNWEQKNISGFGETENKIIWSGHVFRGQLYFGVDYQNDNPEKNHGRLYRTSNLQGTPNWEEVYRSPEGTYWGNLLGDLDGYLYLSVPSEDGVLIYRSLSGNSGTWEVVSLPGLDSSPQNWGILADGATTHRNELYIGIVNGKENFTLWRTDGEACPKNEMLLNWEKISTRTINDPYNMIVQLVFFNDHLYAWTSNPVNGQQVWRTYCGENARK
jgi:hypothetical protein